MRRRTLVGSLILAALLTFIPTTAWASGELKASPDVPYLSIKPSPAFTLTGTKGYLLIVAAKPSFVAIEGSLSVTVYAVSTAVKTEIAVTDASAFVSGGSIPFTPTSPGNYTVGVLFTPKSPTEFTARQEYALLQVRTGGVGASVTAGSATAGTPTDVTMTLGLPSAGDPVEGTVTFSVDADDAVATCVPVRTSPTTASCSSKLPATIAAGDHALTGIWSDSPSYTSATYAGSITVTPAKSGSKGGASGGSGGSGGSSGSSGSGSDSTATPTPTAITPVPSPTAPRSSSAAPAAASAQDDRPASSSDPLFTVALIAAIAIAAALLALAAVLIVRRRRTRTGTTAS